MANRYWVGGSGNWNTTDTTNWSATSGGAGGASVPGNLDDVFFDANSDGGTGFTVTVIATSPTCQGFDASGLDQVMTLAGSVGVTIRGSLVLHASNFVWSNTATYAFTAAGAKTLNTNGVTINSGWTINTAGASWTLAGALTMASGRTLTLTAGTFDTAGYAVTTGLISSSGSGVRALDLDTSTVTLTGTGTVWNLATVTNMTLTAGSSTIVLTGATTTFSGGGLTYGTLTQGNGGVLTIAGSNTIGTLSNSVQPTTLRFTAGTAQTLTAFSLAGTSGNLVTIDSTSAGSAATLSKASGTVTGDYLSIKDSTATGGATWNATNSTDVSGNTGWNFIAGVSGTGNFFALF